MNSEFAIETRNLTKSYDKEVVALDNLSLGIKKGEIFGLLGPNGAGKSSLIGILTGSIHKTSGQALVLGKDVEKDYIFTRRNIGVVPQETISDGFFTIWQIMEFQSGFYSVKNNGNKITEILKRLSLWSKKDVPVFKLSGGMKRRLLIAKALVHDPPVFILDEPTAGVDVFLRVHLWDYVKDINSKGITILLTTHYIEEAERLCNRVGIIDKGKILCLDTVPELIKKHKANNLEEVFIKITGSESELNTLRSINNNAVNTI